MSKEEKEPKEQEPEEKKPAETEPAKPDPKDQEKKFSQEEVNSFNAKSNKAAASKARADLLAELELEDVEAGKASLAKLKEREDAEKSELELAQDKIKELEEEGVQKDENAIASQFKADVVAEAAKQNFSDPNDALALIDPKSANIEEDLTKLAEEKPYLLKSTKTTVNLEPGKPGALGTQPEETREEKRKRLLG